jgi:hypothetical protein
MAAIAIVTVAALACWLVMVYVAAREPRTPRLTGQKSEPATTVAAPGDPAENKHMEAA